MQSFIEMNMDQHDIGHYQLNEIISFVGQLLATLPENQWLMFFSLLTAKVAAEAHHHFHLMYSAWSHNVPILSYEAFVNNLHHSSSFYRELNTSFSSPDFIIGSINSVSENNAAIRATLVETSLNTGRTNIEEFITQNNSRIDEITTNSLANIRYEESISQGIYRFVRNHPYLISSVGAFSFGILFQYREPIMTIGRELMFSGNNSQRSDIVDTLTTNLHNLNGQRTQIVQEIATNPINNTTVVDTINSMTPMQVGGITFIGMGFSLYLLQRGQIKELLKLLSKVSKRW